MGKNRRREKRNRARLCIFYIFIYLYIPSDYMITWCSENKLPRAIYKENYKTKYLRLFTPFPNLITKESYNWWITRRELGFKHQISEAKYQKESVANIWKHSEEFRRRTKWLRNFADKQGGCEIISQPKADCAALRNCPSTWSDLLPIALTSSFQLRFMNRLKHWIVDFLIFETTYSM